MVNILPPEALQAVRRFYRGRVLLVGSLTMIASGAVALLSLIPAYAILSTEGTSDSEFSGAAPSSLSGTDRAEVARTQALLKELGPLISSTSSVLAFLDAALVARPPGISVRNIHITSGETGTLVLSGTASSRDVIIAYRTALSEDPRFMSVSVPIGILVGTEDGRFSVTLTGSF